jgi:two-component system OmpR family response regulator
MNHNDSLQSNPRMNVLLVEDDVSLSDGIARILLGAGHVVDAHTSGVEALEATRRGRFDLMLLDIGLPGIDGYEVLRRLRAAEDPTPVLVLSARDQIGERVYGLDLGADDYLAKPFAMAELGARIRALLRRAHVHSSARITHGPLVMDKAARRAYLSGEHLDLTAREWAVLEILLQKAEKVLSKESIIQLVASWDDDLSLNAIEVYVSRLRAKLEPAGIRIRTVRGFGYMLEEFISTN